MKKAFTLAEVLITLGIVGVVAALTIPNLNQNTSTAKIGPSLFKAVNTIENGNKNLLAAMGISRISNAGVSDYYQESRLSGAENAADRINDEGYPEFKTGFDEKAYTDALSNYINMDFLSGRGNDIFGTNGVGKVSSYDGQSFYGDGEEPEVYREVNSAQECVYKDSTTPAGSIRLGQKYMSKDGMTYVFKVTQLPANSSLSPNKQHIGYVHIDINGNRTKPNAIGKDIFAFTLWNDGSLRPIGAHGWKGGGETNNELWITQCNANGVINGIYCAGSIFENDKKVIY